MTKAKSKRTKPPRTAKRAGEHPFDTISANVQKAHGIVATLQMGLNDEDMAMDVTARDLRNAFWALSDLLWDACKAVDVLTDEHIAEHDRKAGGAL